MSPVFASSVAFAPPRLRRVNKSTVTRSLHSQRGLRTDQAEVWDKNDMRIQRHRLPGRCGTSTRRECRSWIMCSSASRRHRITVACSRW